MLDLIIFGFSGASVMTHWQCLRLEKFLAEQQSIILSKSLFLVDKSSAETPCLMTSGAPGPGGLSLSLDLTAPLDELAVHLARVV
jgi:hypothetical protein